MGMTKTNTTAAQTISADTMIKALLASGVALKHITMAKDSAVYGADYAAAIAK